jgi:hypothetical protein
LQKTNLHMGPCLFPLFLEAIKQLFQLRLDIKNIILYTCLPEIYLILLDVLTGMPSFQLHFFPSQKVRLGFLNSQILLIVFTANKRQRKRPEYQRFVRQLYHICLARIFAPLKSGMTVPEVVRCPDGHFRKAIYSLGPYIADYPEQVWLAGTVQGWCPKFVSIS